MNDNNKTSVMNALLRIKAAVNNSELEIKVVSEEGLALLNKIN